MIERINGRRERERKRREEYVTTPTTTETRVDQPDIDVLANECMSVFVMIAVSCGVSE